MKKKILYILLLLVITGKVYSQNPYLNEWIDYSKTYYKFKLGPVFGYDAASNPIRKGVVRISQPVLAAAGLGAVPSEQFQLWRDGQEVPLYVSVSSGALSSGDYIEFWGEIANGKTDKYLYRDSDYQVQDISCLETDSASYFLTVNPLGNNKRFADAVNDVSNVSIPAEKSFMHLLPRYYRGFYNGGYGIFLEEKLYASSYDVGEGYLSRPIHNNSSNLGNTQLTWTFSNMYVDTSGGPAQVDINLVGSAPNDRSVNVLLNSTNIAQFNMGYFTQNKLSVQVPSSLIANNTAAFIVQNVSTVNDDEMRVGKIEITYPHKYNFENAATFEFYVNASATGRYLKIANFNKGTATPVLYDFTNGKRYIGNTSITDTIQFFLPASANTYHLLLLRSDGSTSYAIGSLNQRNFVDYSQPVNQGKFLIITNPVLLAAAPNDYIQQYADYRSSDSGGNYNAKIVDIHQLEDQFAYGLNMHPLSIKNFLRFARHSFAQAPAYAFLIGKGVTYNSYRPTETNPLTYQIQLVPTFGSPGSDNLLASEDYDPVPATPIGRLSVIKPEEVGIYLEKVKQYESVQRDNSSGSVEDVAWKKKVLQLAGANDPSIESIIDAYQQQYKDIISDTAFGGNVSTYNKSVTEGGAYAQAVEDFTNQYNSGSAMVEYLGHSSSTSIDFNLDNPNNYTNTGGKYPMFIVNGCLAGNIFDYDVNRQSIISTLSEKFIFAPQKGSIGYLSSTSFGVLSYLDIFTNEIYNSITHTQYGNGFGNVMQEAIAASLDYTGNSDFYGQMHAQQLALHGDPAIKLNYFASPDYALDSAGISSSPGYLTVASDSFTVKLKLYNLGKAVSDSVHLKLVRKYPNGNSDVVFSKNIQAVHSEDSITFTLPVVANRDKGTTTITATIDDNNKVTELNEGNNSASVDVHISAADLLPVSPYNYSIVTTNNTDLVASTAYAFDSLTQYVMELDTTALFNSPVKISMQQVSTGGIIEFKNVHLSLNNTVYYWRVSEDSADKHWNAFSFIYRDAAAGGFEQAHFFQHTQSALNNIVFDSTSRSLNFDKQMYNIYVVQSVYPTSGNEDAQFSVSVNGTILSWSACVGHSIMFNVFDPKTLKPVLDSTRPYGAGPTDCKDTMSRYNFEYSTQDRFARKNAMDFLDNFVQNGYYVVVRKIYDLGDADWAPTVWAADTAFYGSNNSLYHRLKDQGTLIDSFVSPRTFIFIFKKNDSANYKTASVLSQGIYDRISLSQNILVNDSLGTVTSPKFGPATTWSKVRWSGTNTNSNNNTHLNIFATDKSGTDSLIYTIPTSQAEQDISSLSAVTYPYVKLQMDTRDSLTQIPYQLQDWAAEFTPVPEGAVATSLGYTIPSDLVYDHDVNTQLDTLNGYIIFKNISSSEFSPLKVNIILYDSANNPHAYTVPRTRSLPAGDTVHIPFSLDVSALPQGTYNLFIDVNPDNDQPEQYHYNNTLYHYVNITRNFILASHQFILNAKAVNKAVQLQWTVANELNVAYYQVEFSKDGHSFAPIGKVNATASTASLKDYSFLHTNPVNGNNYYRIKMIDKDGSVLYTNIRLVQMSLTNIVVYPNPFHSKINVLLKDNTKPAIIKVLDVNGRTILQQTASGSVILNLGNLSAGMYVLQVNDGVSVQSFKVYKQ